MILTKDQTPTHFDYNVSSNFATEPKELTQFYLKIVWRSKACTAYEQEDQIYSGGRTSSTALVFRLRRFDPRTSLGGILLSPHSPNLVCSEET